MAHQGFVKFFGASDNRLRQTHSVIDEVKRAGCHWACTYPVAKRPRSVRDGAIIFMGRLVSEPNDIRVFGRATAMEHRPGRDDATPEDIRARPWKERWPCYIRVHDAEFIDDAMRDGVSLEQLMNELGADSFASTSRNAAEKSGKNTDPRASLRQQSHVELTPRAIAWLNRRLDECFERHGKISVEQLAKLDWPKIPK
jgi:hypothetical protein